MNPVTQTALGALVVCVGSGALLLAGLARPGWLTWKLWATTAGGALLCGSATTDAARAGWCVLAVAAVAFAGLVGADPRPRRTARAIMAAGAAGLLVTALVAQGGLPAPATTSTVAGGPAAPAVATVAASTASSCAASDHQADCLTAAYLAKAERDGTAAALDDAYDAMQAGDAGLAAHCHQVTHALGPIALREANDDLSTALGYAGPRAHVCSDGYVHGVVTPKLRGGTPADVVRRGTAVCLPLYEATPMSGQDCFHILGHEIAIALHDREAVPTVVDSCGTLPQIVQSSCFNGIWMEYFIDLGHLAEVEAHPDPSKATWPCQDATPGTSRSECYREASPQVYKASSQDAGVALDACTQQAPAEYLEVCQFGVGKAVVTQAQGRPDEIIQRCGAAAGAMGDTCLYEAANAVAFQLGRATEAEEVCARMSTGRERCVTRFRHDAGLRIAPTIGPDDS